MFLENTSNINCVFAEKYSSKNVYKENTFTKNTLNKNIIIHILNNVI